MIPLAILTVACMFYFILLTHKRMLQRVFFLGFFFIGLIFILMPELSTELARLVGIGRGVDLILYLSTLFLLFASFNFYIRFRILDERITQLVRGLALAKPYKQPFLPHSHDPEKSNPSPYPTNMPLHITSTCETTTPKRVF